MIEVTEEMRIIAAVEAGIIPVSETNNYLMTQTVLRLFAEIKNDIDKVNTVQLHELCAAANITEEKYLSWSKNKPKLANAIVENYTMSLIEDKLRSAVFIGDALFRYHEAITLAQHLKPTDSG